MASSVQPKPADLSPSPLQQPTIRPAPRLMDSLSASASRPTSAISAASASSGVTAVGVGVRGARLIKRSSLSDSPYATSVAVPAASSSTATAAPASASRSPYATALSSTATAALAAPTLAAAPKSNAAEPHVEPVRTAPPLRKRPARPKSAKKGGRTKPSKDLWKEVTARLAAPHAAGSGARAVRSATRAARAAVDAATQPVAAKRMMRVVEMIQAADATNGRPSTAQGRTVVEGQTGRPGSAKGVRPATAYADAGRRGFAAALRARASAAPDAILWRRAPDGQIFESDELAEELEATVEPEEADEEEEELAEEKALPRDVLGLDVLGRAGASIEPVTKPDPVTTPVEAPKASTVGRSGSAAAPVLSSGAAGRSRRPSADAECTASAAVPAKGLALSTQASPSATAAAATPTPSTALTSAAAPAAVSS